MGKTKKDEKLTHRGLHFIIWQYDGSWFAKSDEVFCEAGTREDVIADMKQFLDELLPETAKR